MISTPEDLTKWVRLLLEGHVLKPKQWSELTSLVTIPSGQPIAQTTAENAQGFALGLFQDYQPKTGFVLRISGSHDRPPGCVFVFSSVGRDHLRFHQQLGLGAQSKVNSVLFHTLYDTLKVHRKM
jgi:hypothetical protein